MFIAVVGLNHKTAPIDIREKFYLNPTQQDLFLSELKNNPAIAEGFVLSTCNRTEVYAHIIEDHFDPTLFIRMIMNIKKIQFGEEFVNYFYQYTGPKAVEHLFKVVSGLDSLVLGEKQILGQVKASLERARLAGMFSKYFNLLANATIRVGKKSQNETNISIGGSSVGWAAIEKAENSLGTLLNKTIVMIGAGKMGEVAANQLKNKGFKKLFVMNRTHETAEELALKFGGEAVGFMDIKETLVSSDICLCSVSAPHYILDAATVKKIMPLRGGRPLLLIDISMPRNIDPHVSLIDGVNLFHIDDLQEVVDSNMKLRQDAIASVEEIVAQKMIELDQKINRVDESNTELVSDISE